MDTFINFNGILIGILRIVYWIDWALSMEFSLAFYALFIGSSLEQFKPSNRKSSEHLEPFHYASQRTYMICSSNSC